MFTDPLIDAKAFAHFDPVAMQWDPYNAYALAQASELAYATDDDIIKALGAWGFTSVFAPQPINDIRAIVASNSKMVLVMFRGTISEKDGKIDLNNWKTDADVSMVPLNEFFPSLRLLTNNRTEYLVHRGFAEAVNTVWGATSSTVAAQRGTKPVWITGHSLGGGMAHIAAVLLMSQSVNSYIQGLYTFGQPRTGNKAFCRLSIPNYHRVVNCEDIVTRIPRLAFRLPIEVYHHTGQLTYFDDAGKPFHQERFWHDLWVEFKMSRFSLGTLMTDPVEDHFMGRYLLKLKSLIVHPDAAQ